MKRRRFVRLRIALLVVFFALVAIPREKNLVQCWRKLRRLNADIGRLEKENAELQKRIEAVRTDPATVESIARQQGLVRDGEIRIHIRRDDAPR